MGLGTDTDISSAGRSPDEAGSRSTSQYSDSANEFNMFPMVEAMPHIETKSTSDVINSVHSLTRGGNDGDRCQAQQQRGTELQAKAGKGKGSASHTTIPVGFSRTGNTGDEGIVCSTGEGRGANIGLTVYPPVPTAASGSLVASRVPLARVTIIRWALPATELTSRRFLWRDGVKTIIFGYYGGRYLKSGPSKKFEVLSFAECCNRSLEPGSVPFPPGLESVHLCRKWIIDLHGARENWPDSLKTFRFPEHFNQPLAGEGFGLPQGLREMTMGEKFNQSLIGVEWPPLLRKLTFSRNFDQSLEGVKFPSGLQEFFLRGSFNHEIGGVVWPQGLERLTFGMSFNKALVLRGAERGATLGRKHPLPAGLKFLDLGHCFNQPLSGNELPDGLEVLQIGSKFGFLSSVRWPPGLTELSCQCARCFVSSTSPIELPPKLKTLMVGNHFNSPLTTVALPPTLRSLDLGNAFNHPIGWADGDAPLLPDGLQELRVGTSFNQGFENVRLPVGLTSLVMLGSSYFDRGLAGVMWPPKLNFLSLGSWFNQPIEGITFPETLYFLSFGEGFDYSLQDVHPPDALEDLVFRGKFPAYHLREFYWPRSLKRLDIDKSRFVCREALARWVAQHV